jgi:hypothetical protein
MNPLKILFVLIALPLVLLAALIVPVICIQPIRTVKLGRLR